MEDLAPSGFKMANRKRGLGLRHSLLALRSLARFHAASHALLQRQPELTEKLGNTWRAMYNTMETFVVAIDTFTELNDAKPGAFNVITHGDYWSPTLEALLAAVDLHGPFSLFLAPARPIVRAEKPVDLNAMYEGDHSSLLPLYQQAEVKKWMQRVLPDYARRDCILFNYRTPRVSFWNFLWFARRLVRFGTFVQFRQCSKELNCYVKNKPTNDLEMVETKQAEKPQAETRPPPSWLNKELIQQALRNGGDSNSHVETIDVSMPVAAGENFISAVYRAKATLTDGQERSFIIKGPAAGAALSSVTNEVRTFEREVTMLAQVIPQMEAMLEKAAPGRFPPLAPHCYLHGTSPVDFIVLEDLAPLGFKMADRKRGLGLRHSLLALRSLARFHAASHALLQRQPELAETLDNTWRASHQSMGAFVEGKIQAAVEACRSWPGFEDCAHRLEKFKAVALDTFAQLNDPKDGAFNVITHGDYWVNNMMFCYEDQAVKGHRALDLQIAHVASPVIDVLDFLVSSLNDHIHESHQDLLLREYHWELKETLELLGLQAPSLEALLSAVDVHGPCSLYGMISRPVLKAEKGLDVSGVYAGDHSCLVPVYEQPDVKKKKPRNDLTMVETKQAQEPRGDTRPPPSWLNKELIQQALRNTGDSNSQVETFDVSVPVAAGDNYGSSIYRAKATLTDGQERSFIIKGPAAGAALSSATTEARTFEREVTMLAQVIPQMEALLEEAAPGRFPPLAPRCYHHGTSPVEFLVMEDLAPPGFKLADRKRGLGLRHSVLALRTLARFHAASHALLQRQPELAETLDNTWRAIDKSMRVFVKGQIQGAVEATRSWPGFEECADRLEKFKDVAMDMFAQLNDPKDGAFNVITHGDYWVNNMMFSYEDQAVKGHRALDLQPQRPHPRAPPRSAAAGVPLRTQADLGAPWTSEIIKCLVHLERNEGFMDHLNHQYHSYVNLAKLPIWKCPSKWINNKCTEEVESLIENAGKCGDN
ncbi:Uncharacterized protein GBIM_20918, partial [Gryllus bimaculatus]